jgi:CRP-like cAMP-binding protein
VITVADIRATGGLAAFTDAELELLLGVCDARTFAPREALCRQGRPASSCFVIVSGNVEVVKETDGRARLLTRLVPGTIAGHLALVDRAPRTASLYASTEVTALELTRDVFDRLVGSTSPLAYRFQVEIAVATGRQLREADRRLAAIVAAREVGAARDAELAHLRDAISDLDVPVEPFDVVEITPPDRVIDRG